MLNKCSFTPATNRKFQRICGAW